MKQMRLFLLFVAMLAIQPAFAGSKIDAVKKAGRVGLHSAEVAMGFFFIFDYLVTFWPFQADLQKKLEGNNIRSQIIILPIATHALLAEGFRGLDRELHLAERYTKLINRVRNRKPVRNV